MLRGSSGQRLAVQFSGDLDGRPALFFHGTPGSRLFIPPEEVSQQAYAWVVTVDRPGYGLSDAASPDGTIAAVAQDILSVVTEEVGGPLAVVGYSGGAPYALACGALAPDVVTGVAVVSGDAPPRLPPEPSELSASEIELVQRIRRDPSSGADPLLPHAQAFANDPLVYMTKPVVGADAAIRARPEVRALLERTAREAGRQGAAGLVMDWLLELLPWGFELGEIERPVAIWYGTDDPGPAPHAALRLLSEIPHSLAYPVEGGGHELILTHWREILRSLQIGGQAV